MLWGIKRKLNKLSKRAEPDPRFRAALKSELLSRLERKPGLSLLLRPMAAAVSLASVLGLGTAAYAYASDDVLPDHPLYPIRMQVERIEEGAAVSQPDKAAVKLKHLRRRVREMEIAAAKRGKVDRPQVEKFTQQFEGAIEAGEALQNGERRRFDEAISVTEQQQMKIIKQTGENLKDEQERESLEVTIREETKKVGERLEKLNERRRLQFERQLKRREAVEMRLPWRIENGETAVLPDDEDGGPSGPDTAPATPPVPAFANAVPPPIVLPLTDKTDGMNGSSGSQVIDGAERPERELKPANMPRREALQKRMRDLLERGQLKLLRRPNGGFELVATSSTPPGVRLLLKDLNLRLAREPGLIKSE